jgi:tRNA (Thr-GGU) A37 N-methylase
MELKASLEVVGIAHEKGGRFWIEVEEGQRPGLSGLGGFGWVSILWWASLAPAWRSEMLVLDSPYKVAPSRLGVFATRSPLRPNPICVSPSRLVGLDEARGILEFAWFDCEEGTPILDLKPYQPSADRVEAPGLPAWCSSWPRSIEASGDFDWSEVFNF